MRYRRLFLPGHSYYFTLVTYRRRPILVTHIGELREAFVHTKTRIRFRLDAIVVPPDHIHMILTPDEAERYPEIIKQIKRSFVHNLPETFRKQARLELTSSQYRRGQAGIWQSRYYEHAIRNEKDMEEKMLYLRDNPVKHGLCECAEDWPYSSFNR